jgi:hypothetical protein
VFSASIERPHSPSLSISAPRAPPLS